jgi:hypothetical protein
MFFIGDVRYALMSSRWDNTRWNMWVRDITARIEGTWLIRSEP